MKPKLLDLYCCAGGGAAGNDASFFRQSTWEEIQDIRMELGKKKGFFDGKNYLD